MESLVHLERGDGVAVLTLNRPERRNALSAALCRELSAALDAVRGDGATRAVVIRGAGTAAFSGGYDVDDLKASADLGDLLTALGDVERCPLPTIALLFGHVVGAGLELAATCDLRVAADDARLSMPPARQGILYRYDGTEKLVRLVGPAFAKELFFTARAVTARRAAEMGLVNLVAAAAEAEAAALALAREIAANAPLSVQGAKRMVERAAFGGPSAGHADLDRLVVEARESADREEGRRAAASKRPPRFEGR